MEVEVAVSLCLWVPNSPYGLCGRKATSCYRTELRSSVKDEVAVLIALRVSVDVKQHRT